MGAIGWVVVVVLGVVVVAILLRVVWLAVNAGIEVADVVGDIRAPNKPARKLSFDEEFALAARLNDKKLSAHELKGIAYDGRFASTLNIHDRVLSHPSLYPELKQWIKEFRGSRKKRLNGSVPDSAPPEPSRAGGADS